MNNFYKRIFVLSILQMCLLCSFAQIRYGIKAGINASQYKYSGKSADQIGGLKTGWQLGGLAELCLKGNWHLQSGVEAGLSKGEMTLTNEFGYKMMKDVNIRTFQISIPLELGYDLRVSRNVVIKPHAGLWGAHSWGAGKSALSYYNDGKLEEGKWNPMKGYSFVTNVEGAGPHENGIGKLSPLSYGVTAGVDVALFNKYILSMSYREAVNKVQKTNGLRPFMYSASIGYLF